jgi:hypothetical protein
MKIINFGIIWLAMSVVGCAKDAQPDPTTTTPTSPTNSPTDINNTVGFGILNKVKGIWNGPVISTTPLGSYPEWIVDFRPISAHQISAKNELDTLNDIHMSLFIAKYNGEYRVCFRNGGSFAGQTRVSYFLVDSVAETSTHSYYRFSEIIKGKDRAYTEFLFKNDSMIVTSYTNKYNMLPTAELHKTWKAKLQNLTSCEAAVSHFEFPQKTLTKDFTATFNGQTEAVYYSITGGDPYPEADQPYLGKTTVNYMYSGGLVPDYTKKVFVMICTQPLISGMGVNTANLKTRSRYVILSADDADYVFNYMHPGTYYVYAMYDSDENGVFSSGDWVSSSNTSFTLSAEGTAQTTVQINFNLP